MRQSVLFYQAQRTTPKDEVSLNAKLLSRAGFINKLTAGIYSFLPLGMRVLRKIENVIREEMTAIGAQEILMPALQPKENWQRTGRWENLNVLFKLKGRGGKNYVLGATHEEIVTPLAKMKISSYKDLPIYLFQIQNKFRDEPRAKSGLLRGREFIMKDLYSFHTDQKDLDDYYEIVSRSYLKIFKRCGLSESVYVTLASGGTFSKHSHEFQVAIETGEDTIFICQQCRFAVNSEIKEEITACANCGLIDFKKAKAVEIGNIFKLGVKYSKPFNLNFRDADGKEKPVMMGCYGIGLGRLMGTIVEVHHDKNGIIWPEEIAPFKIHLLRLGENIKVKKAADQLYERLIKQKIEILYDDRDVSAGAKFAEADLIGIPWRAVISEKTLPQNKIEVKKRGQKEIKLIKYESFSL